MSEQQLSRSALCCHSASGANQRDAAHAEISEAFGFKALPRPV